VREKPHLSAQTDPFYGPALKGVEQVSAASEYHVAIGMLTNDILNAPNEFRFVRNGASTG
jgi:hypothetical protein